MAPPITQRVTRALDHDYSAAFSIGAGAAVSLLWSALDSRSYQRVIITTWSGHVIQLINVNSLHSIVVNGLMTVFFFAIGLELSRELRSGTLANRSNAVPPVLGALGGMAGTALLSLVVGAIAHSPALRHGWGVPMATDIAFTLGVLALVGRGLPASLRLFLLSLAVADDILSVVILAFTGATHLRNAGLCAIVVVAIVSWSALRQRSTNPVRLLVLVALWSCFVWANVEAPLAGVIAGLLVNFDDNSAPRLERQVGRCSVGLVLPLFALVSCGVQWQRLSLHRATLTIVLGTIGVRIVGKVLGITGGVALARLVRCRLHPSITWPLLASVALLCAIGFTVPLLFANELFGPQSPAYGAFTLGLLLCSLIAGVVGVPLLRMQLRRN
jgi:NhaA family Na+:H+ antiporter